MLKTAFLFLLLTLTFCRSNQKVKAGQDILEEIKAGRDISYEGRTFDTALDFSTLQAMHSTGDKTAAGIVASGLTFKNCTFRKKISSFRQDEKGQFTTSFLKNLTFINCIFEEEVNLRGSTINGIVNFTGSRFLKSCNFEEAAFQRNTYFSSCQFSQEVRFQNAVFAARSDFMNAEFHRNTSFQSAYFGQDAQMGVAKFHQYADFSLVTFNTNALFNYAQFNGRSTFTGAIFRGRADLNDITVKSGDFKGCYFYGPTRMNKLTVGEQLNLSESVFITGKPEMEAAPAGKVLMEKIRINLFSEPASGIK